MITFKHFEAADHPRVIDFFVELNEKKRHMNWNWARFEWGILHSLCDRRWVPLVGLWLESERVVGVAAFDTFPGDGFCGVLEGYERILPDILQYAEENLRNENGLGIAVRAEDKGMTELLLSRGYEKTEEKQPMLRVSLEEQLKYAVPDGLTLRPVRVPEEREAFQWLFWQGFDHGDDYEAFLRDGNSPIPYRPNEKPDLRLVAAEENGDLAATCEVWYKEGTDYAYVEPVCTAPCWRGKGVGRAVVSEALNRARALGAKEAFVLSDQVFYKKLGFAPFSEHVVYWKK